MIKDYQDKDYRFRRSAPLPVRLDGFSVGAVIGFSAQETIVCLANDDDVNAFKAEKRAMKLGVDIGLSMMDKYDKAIELDTQNVMQTGDNMRTRAFTISRRDRICLCVDAGKRGA